MTKKLTTGGFLRSLLKWGITGDTAELTKDLDPIKKGLTNGSQEDEKAKVIEATWEETPRGDSEHEGAGRAPETPKTSR